MKNYLLLLALATSFMISSCGKDDDDDKGPSKSALLANKNWMIIGLTETKSNGTGTIDTYSTLKNCVKDNILRFTPDNKFSVTEGATKCDISDPQEMINGTWALTDDGTRITGVAKGYGAEIELVELTNSKLIVKYLTIKSGITSVNQITCSAQ